jgi:hypothetical protein
MVILENKRDIILVSQIYSGVIAMNEAKERLLKLINEIPESEAADVLDFAEYLPELNLYKELSNEDNEIPIQYWDSDIDEEVWKDL